MLIEYRVAYILCVICQMCLWRPIQFINFGDLLFVFPNRQAETSEEAALLSLACWTSWSPCNQNLLCTKLNTAENGNEPRIPISCTFFLKSGEVLLSWLLWICIMPDKNSL